MKFQQKVVFLTGASSGIGEALALELALQGAAVVVTARRVDRLEQLASRIVAAGGRALALEVDVTHEGSLRTAVERSVQEFGRLDVVIANAGFGVAGAFETLSDDDYRRQFETNVFGLLNTARAGLPALRQSRGQLVLMGSVAGYIASGGSTPYAMSKFAVRAFADGIRAELAGSGVGVTLLTPGFVNSEIRLVNNRGELKGSKDPVPAFLCMAADKAARQMAHAIHRRQHEAIITKHGKLLVFLSRHFPGLVGLLATKLRRDSDKGFRLRR